MINEKKRIVIYKKVIKDGKIMISVKANEFFRLVNKDFQKIGLLNMGSKWNSILKTLICDVPLIHSISKAMKKDVDWLLTVLFETNWKEDGSHAWYKHILCNDAFPTSAEEDDVGNVLMKIINVALWLVG